jgi:hypothetical protein
MADDLIPIASYRDAAEAELARCVLGMAGVPARLSGACFLTWFWYLSYACGGVQVLVRAADGQAAREVLSDRLPASPLLGPRQACRHCGQSLCDGWDSCWRCGRTADGQPGGEPAAADGRDAAEPRSILLEALLVLGALGFTLAIAGGVNWTWLGLLATLLVVVLALRGKRPEETSAAAAEPDDSVAETKLPSWPVGRLEETARRAWQSAVLGLLWFPPLGIYSLYLLGRILGMPVPCTRRAKRYLLGASIATFLIAVMLFLFLAAVLAVPLGETFFDALDPTGTRPGLPF